MCASLLHYLMLAPCTARVIHCRVSVPPAFHTDVTESNSYRSLFNIQNKLNLGTFTLLDFSQKPGYQQEMGKHENRNRVRCTGPPSMRGRVLDTGHSIPQRPLQWLNPNTRLVRQAVLDTIIPPYLWKEGIPGEEREEEVTDTSKPPFKITSGRRQKIQARLPSIKGGSLCLALVSTQSLRLKLREVKGWTSGVGPAKAIAKHGHDHSGTW